MSVLSGLPGIRTRIQTAREALEAMRSPAHVAWQDDDTACQVVPTIEDFATDAIVAVEAVLDLPESTWDDPPVPLNPIGAGLWRSGYDAGLAAVRVVVVAPFDPTESQEG